METNLLSKTMKENLSFFLKLNKINEKEIKSVGLNGFRDLIIVKTKYKTLKINYISLKELGETML